MLHQEEGTGKRYLLEPVVFLSSTLGKTEEGSGLDCSVALIIFSPSFPFSCLKCLSSFVSSWACPQLWHGAGRWLSLFPSICACVCDAEPLSFHPMQWLGASELLRCAWCHLPFQSPMVIQVQGEGRSLLPRRAVN